MTSGQSETTCGSLELSTKKWMWPGVPGSLWARVLYNFHGNLIPRIHGHGIFTYMNGWFLWFSCSYIYHTWVLWVRGRWPPKCPCPPLNFRPVPKGSESFFNQVHDLWSKVSKNWDRKHPQKLTAGGAPKWWVGKCMSFFKYGSIFDTYCW